MAIYSQTLAASELSFQPCWLTGSGGNGNLRAECATWQQPLDRSRPDGEQIDIHVTRLKSTALEPATDAFTLINGGPGGSSIDMLVAFASIARTFTRERDVIVIDQRGTGRSSPLTCDGVTETTEDISIEATVAITQECLQALPHDPRFFTTTSAVNDLEALRAALGYEQLSIYGVSYGTRVALQYARQFPERTRTVVVDGIIPPTRALGSLIAIHSQAALDQILARCEEDTDCAERFPDIAEQLTVLAEELRTQPVKMNIQHPVTGLPTDIELSQVHLAAWLRFSLYSTETAALIPLIIHEATARQNYLPIAANALRMIHDISTSLNYGMHNAVVCTEDAPFYDADADLDAMDATYLGRHIYETLEAVCSIWPQGELNAALKSPLESSVPTLVLSGELDPITPPAWGEEIMPGLSNALHVVAPGQGHGTIARGCIPKLVVKFVESADLEALDTACIDHLAAYPFFVDLMGPPP